MKIGILGFGEAGSQVADQAASRGFSVVAVNTAKIDLDKIKNVPKDCKLHFENWEGAGRNRDVGKEAAVVNAEKILEKVQQKLSDCDMVFVAGSLAGGTAAGGMPVGIEILSSIKNIIGIIPVFPEVSESPKAQMNALETFSELSSFEQLGGIFVLDNEKTRNVFGDLPENQRHEKSKADFIECLAEIAELTKQRSFVSNFDKNDLLEIITERGCASVSKIIVEVDSIKSESDVTELIRKSWENNHHPMVQRGQIVKAAVLGKMPEHISKFISFDSIFSNIGMPFDIMKGYYDNKGMENHCIFYTILTGLSFPNDRLNQMDQMSKESEETIIKQVELARTQTFETPKWSSKFNRTTKKETQELPLKDRLSKFR